MGAGGHRVWGAIFWWHLGRAGAQGRGGGGGSSRHENRIRLEILSVGPTKVPLGGDTALGEGALGVDVVLHEVLQAGLPAARRGGQLLVLGIVHSIRSLRRYSGHSQAVTSRLHHMQLSTLL